MGSLGNEKLHAGFVDWNPQTKTRYWMQCVNEVLDQYKSYWPLTIRQIFYRLVASYEYDKTEQAYSRLINYLGRARRAQMIPFGAIRDDGATTYGMGGFESVEDWLSGVEDGARSFSYERMNFQPVRIELFCEANGMVPLLANAVGKYGVDVHSGGGFNSLTTVHSTARRIASDRRETLIFNFGDYDPSGESIFDSFRQDVERFTAQISGDWGKVEFRRVALLEEQVDEMGIPTAPPKSTDSRSRNWEGDTAQLEAIPPDDLARMAEEAVLSELDRDIHKVTIKRENKIRERLGEEIDQLREAVGDYDGYDFEDDNE